MSRLYTNTEERCLNAEQYQYLSHLALFQSREDYPGLNLRIHGNRAKKRKLKVYCEFKSMFFEFCMIIIYFS